MLRTSKPRDLEDLSQADMKTATQYSSGILDLSSVYGAKVAIEITHGGGSTTTGLVTLTCRMFADIGGNEQIGDDIDVLVDISTKASGKHEVWWGHGVAGANRGGGTLDADLDVLAFAEFLELELDVTEASDGTTCVADVWLSKRYERK